MIRTIIKLDRSQIETTIKGDGPAIVLITGMGADVSELEPLAQHLTETGYKTISVNYRGIGDSDGELEGATLHDFAKDVAGVIYTLQLAPAHVVGAATGNRVARCLAVDFPDAVRSLTLLGAGGAIEPDPEATAALFRMFQPHISEAERLEAAKIALFSAIADPEKIKASIKPSPVISAHAKVILGAPLSEWWHGGAVPIHVIQALDDRLAKPENGRLLAEQYGNRIEVSEIPVGGHVFFLEEPRMVAAMIAAYLARFGGF